MIVMVDAPEEKVEGFGYINKFGNQEVVRSYGAQRSYFRLCAGEGNNNADKFEIYYDDIPKLVKALEAMHKLYVEGKVGSRA